jgi:hypothetical protein
MRTFIAYLQMAMLPVLFKMAAGIRHEKRQRSGVMAFPGW